MDSFSEPALTQPSPPLPSILDTIRSLEDQHAAKGIPLSGRVIHLLVGWPGDIYAAPPAFSATQSPDNPDRPKIPAEGLRGDDRAALEDAIREYEDAEHEGGGRGLKLVPVWLDDKVAHGHYDGYCKQTLWPLFHYLLWQDVATEYASADRHWPAYEHANHAFADKLKQVYQPGDLVWVHDYHLLLVPQMVRQMLPDAYVGLFVHTPFPSSEVFRCLPRRKEILDGMLGANLVCFQTYSYSRHFTSSCVRVCGYEIAAGAKQGIDVAGHVTGVRHCPVGVDAERVGKDVLRPGIQPKLEALRALYEGKKIIVGRDKLDVVKGVVQKLRAFNKLLTDYPEWRGRVVLIQVTSPALADSPRLERQISEIVAQVNGEWGSLDFVPVHHYHQTIKKDEFYALLSVADLGVITPLRDGMNTTSMEFVIAQERGGRSPLVLSEFMGISGDMGEAMLVNPWNLGEVAAAMNHGLLMSDEEKARRHASLYKQVTTHTSHTWAAMLVQMLLERVGAAGMARQTPRLPMDVMEGWYRRAGKRLFLFDYDGTLTPIVKTPSMAVPSEGTLEALAKLTADARNVVYIISGRDQAFLEQHLGHFAALGMSAEHGGFIREPGQEGWTNFTESLDMSWMSEVHEIFKYYTERTTGSHIEVKKSSITWHYRSSDPEWGAFQCRQCQDLLENNLVHKRPIEVLVGKKNLEVRPIAVNKGEIVKRILYLNPDAQFVFCAGDDKTDEDMFRALLFPSGATKWKMDAPLSVTLAVKDKSVHPQQELALAPEAIFTTAVGHSSKKTLASWHVTTPEEVVESMLNIVNDVKSSL
ncbi:glycosyltransferase family 20 protein [Neolentinus lepideus HHB14362 ss-1]|uniref:Glycosyltransferase family 20 protein n=1 Tax=Neolentinus lepideus HHB14362 ss-1 TaxID=1314782 RepID=A0A165S9S7_9AGAM|nr:glycosyltransferase family 20 protein [Neolentinus lepideus HHB14362 ss-1]